MTYPVVIARHFHLPGSVAERLLVFDAGQWRPLSEEELSLHEGVKVDDLAGCVCLFALPTHLREAFWAMIEQTQQGGAATDGFEGFAAEVASFLAFKHLAMPTGAVCELVLAQAGGPAGLDRSSLWGLVNLGEDETDVILGDLRLRLRPGEGCRAPAGARLEVWPPPREGPDVLLVVREQL